MYVITFCVCVWINPSQDVQIILASMHKYMFVLFGAFCRKK